MWNVPVKSRLEEIPYLYTTEKTPIPEKLIYLHFFIANCDWYVAEFDGEDTFWGYVVINGDFENSEWGYFSFSYLRAIRMSGWLEVDCELEIAWEIRPFVKIKNFQKMK